MKTSGLVEHFFRHEYGKLVATLSRRVGVHNIEAVEDASQSALMVALEKWRVTGPPRNPSAWLFRVAYNNVRGDLRRASGRRRILERTGDDAHDWCGEESEARLAGEVQDDLLRWIFVCCDEALPVESRLALSLKTLCGFSVREIAHRLFASEANVYKRLGRARSRLRDRAFILDDLSEAQYVARRPAVHHVLYLMFTEGYLSSHAEIAIRRELCDEALRLGHILAEHPAGRSPETAALLALMHLHSARLSARADASGGLLLLQEQDRTRWDRDEIEVGLVWLAKSAQGDAFSRYHAEAGIAAEHGLAPSFEETNWAAVVECYALLERTAPSALHRLNRAVATAEWRGAAAGLAVLQDFEPPTWLAGSYQWSAVLADLHRRCGNCTVAARYRELALELAPTEAVKALLGKRLSEPPGRR